MTTRVSSKLTALCSHTWQKKQLCFKGPEKLTNGRPVCWDRLRTLISELLVIKWTEGCETCGPAQVRASCWGKYRLFWGSGSGRRGFQP